MMNSGKKKKGSGAKYALISALCTVFVFVAVGGVLCFTVFKDHFFPKEEDEVISSSEETEIPSIDQIGDFDSELIEEFFCGFVRTSNITLHLKKLDGRNSHHIAEALFKAFARCMRKAVAPDVDFIDEIPSSKGVL